MKGKGAALLARVKKQQKQAQANELHKITKRKQKKTAFDKVNFNG